MQHKILGGESCTPVKYMKQISEETENEVNQEGGREGWGAVTQQ